MKKYKLKPIIFYVLPLVIFFANCTSKSNSKTDLQKEMLKGNVKSVFEETSKYANNIERYSKEFEGGKSFKKFNSDGYIVNFESYMNNDGRLNKKILYEYEGDKIHKEMVYDGHGNLEAEKNYAYNNSGHLISEIDCRISRYCKNTSYKYNRNNQLIEKITIWDDKYGKLKDFKKYLFDGSPESIVVYQYDKKNRIIKKEKILFDETFPIALSIHADTRKFKTTHRKLIYLYEYDDKGYQLETIYRIFIDNNDGFSNNNSKEILDEYLLSGVLYNKDINLLDTEFDQQYKYDHNNNIILFYVPSGISEYQKKVEYKYNDNNERILEINFSSDRFINIENSNLMVYKMYISSYKYLYDDKGNWYKKIKNYNNESITIVKRDIEYYD